MSDDIRRLDLIQRYAEQLGKGGPNMASFRVSPGAEIPARIGAAKDFDPPPGQASVPHPAPLDIDLDRLAKLGCIRPDGGRKTQLVEQFQIIKRPLLQKALQREDGPHTGNAVMITSARPGEGKSFVALNLAMSIASEHDLYVMLVDGDLYHQSLPDLLGVTVDRGLTDLLLDDGLDVADVLLRTNIAHLTLLPAGRRRPHSTELLSSHRMAALMDDLVSRYPDRIILLDSPPVLACTETGVLASHVGQIVMVVEQNRTAWRLVEKALGQLSDCEEISFVLNKVEPLWERDFGAYYC